MQIENEILNIYQNNNLIEKTVKPELNCSLSISNEKILDENKIRLKFYIYSSNTPLSINWVILLTIQTDEEITNVKNYLLKNKDILESLDDYWGNMKSIVDIEDLPNMSEFFLKGKERG